MSTARRTVRNTVLLAFFEIANPLLSLLLIGSLSRSLGAAGLGTYNLLLNFFFVAHSFTSLGLNTLITRDVSRDPKKAASYLCSSSALGIVISVLMAVALTFVLPAAGYGPTVAQCGWLVGLSLLPSIILLYSESIFIACEKIQFIVCLAMIENLLRVLSGVYLIHSGFGVTSLIASFTAFRYLTLILNLWAFHVHISPLTWTFQSEVVRDLARSVPVFGTILIVATLYLRTDVFLLSKMATLAAVGYYTAAYRLFSIAQVIPKSFNTSIFPVFSNLFSQSTTSFHRAKGISIRYILIVVLPIAAGIHGLADQFIRLLYGPEFGPAIPALRIIIWTLIPYSITRVLASSLFASNRQVVDLRVNSVALVFNVSLNLVLIPPYGAVGCAWATLLSMFFFLGCQIVYLREEILPILRELMLVRMAAAASGVMIWVGATPGFPLSVRIAGGAVLYSVLVLFLQAVSLRELRTIIPVRILAALPWKFEP